MKQVWVLHQMLPLLLLSLLLTPIAAVSIGLAVLDSADPQRAGQGRLRSVLASGLNPLTVASLLALAVAASGWQVPQGVRGPLDLIAGLAVPAMLLAYGMSLRWGPVPFVGGGRREVVVASVLKLIVMPLVAWGLALAWGLEAEGPAAMFDFAVSELAAALGSGMRRRLSLVAATEWGVDPFSPERGGLKDAHPAPSRRTVYLVQRKETKIGAGLGKTTGWVHRAAIKAKGVHQITGAAYERIDDAGLHITVDGAPRLLEVDNVVVCTGQESVRDLVDPLRAKGVTVHVIGGADVAAELDAKRAIRQGTELAAAI